MQGFGARIARIVLVVGVVAGLGLSQAPAVLAGIPQLSTTTVTTDQMRVVVSAADAFRQVDLYTRQLDTQLWTVYSNIGTTDQYGSLATTLTVGYGSYGLARESYVIVAGLQSSISVLNGTGGSGAVTLNPTTLNIWVGQSADVWASGGIGSYYVASNSSAGVATTAVNGNRMTVSATAPGQTTIRVCASGQSGYYASYCADLSVWVQGNTWQQIQLLTTSLPQGTQGQYYTASLQATGGQAPYTYMVVSGQMPSGLALSTTGYVSGVPNVSGTYSLQIRVQDSYGASSTQTLTLTIANTTNWWGSTVNNNGQLVNEGGTIFMVYRGTKTGFASADAFVGLGYTFGSVDQTYTGLPTSGRIVYTAAAAHPWGSWLKAGQTVYFAHETGLIPITAYDVFLQNGGQDRWVVPMNMYDWQRPILSYLTYADARLSQTATPTSSQRTAYGYVGQTLSVQLPSVVGATRWNVASDQNVLRVTAHYAPTLQSGGAAYEQIDLLPLQRGTYTVTFTNAQTSWQLPEAIIVYTFIIQ